MRVQNHRPARAGRGALGLLALCALAALCPRGAPADAAVPSPREYGVLKLYDTNGDGYVSIEVKTAEFAGDAWITAKVKAALLHDSATTPIEVKVQTQDGTLQLSGFVNSAQQAARAADIAAHVHGVRTVINSLVVKS